MFERPYVAKHLVTFIRVRKNEGGDAAFDSNGDDTRMMF